MAINDPLIGQYDYLLGIDSQIIDYIKESTEVESRISPMVCYLLQQTPSGSAQGSSGSVLTVSSYVETSPNYRAVIWASGSNHPDLRPYVNNGAGAITVRIDGVPASRVLEVEDLSVDSEFAVVKRRDLISGRVELVFNANFNASAHTITYFYTTMEPGINDVRMMSDEDQPTKTFFGWTQYLNSSSDVFRGPNQILVRVPLTTRDIIVNEEGLVTLEENDSWMIWQPYVRDFDILIATPSQTTSGREERFEITDKRDSVIQGSLITQRFKLKYIEPTDARYNIPYVTT